MYIFKELSVEEALRKLAIFNELTNFGLTSEDFARLAATAPPWPTTPGHIRSLRVRQIDLSTHGYDRATATFKLHVKALYAMRGKRFYETALLAESHIDYLPAYGMKIERTTVCEWIIINLVANEGVKVEDLRYSLADMQHRFCADELLAAAWLYPEAFMQILDETPPRPYSNEVNWKLAAYESSSDCTWGPAWAAVALHAKHGRECTIDCEQTRRLNAFDGLYLDGWEGHHCFIPEIVA